jgi:hypothetical protein
VVGYDSTESGTQCVGTMASKKRAALNPELLAARAAKRAAKAARLMPAHEGRGGRKQPSKAKPPRRATSRSLGKAPAQGAANANTATISAIGAARSAFAQKGAASAAAFRPWYWRY